jgi:hypothetical protein
MSSRIATVPTVIANQTPTSASREANTQVKRHDGVTNKLKDAYRPALFRGETVTSLDGLARGIVMTVQDNHAKTRTAAQDEDFPPSSEEFSWKFLWSKGSQLRKKESLYMEETTPRQCGRSRSEIRLDGHKIPGESTLR